MELGYFIIRSFRKYIHRIKNALLLNDNIVFPAVAEYSYFSVDFRPKIFL